MTKQEKVKQFHERVSDALPAEERLQAHMNSINLAVQGGGLKVANLLALRQMLIDEEFSEAREALGKLAEAVYEKRMVGIHGLKEHVLKELADLLYVVYGTAVLLGLDLDEAFSRVHESNMSKVPEDASQALFDETGKLMKPSGYSPPDLKDLICL